MPSTQSVDPNALEPIAVTVYEVPTTGGTINLTQKRSQIVLLDPAIGLLALTINFPSSPNDGDRVRVGTSKSITVLTMNGGGGFSILGALSSLILGGFGAWIFNAGAGKWFRIG